MHSAVEDQAFLIAKRVVELISKEDPLITPEWLSPQQAARLIGFSVGTLEQWRSDRGTEDGPPYSKFANKIRYNATKLRQWAEDRSVKIGK